MLKELASAMKSKRTIVALISCLFATVNAQLSNPIVDEDLLNKLVVIVSSLIVGDSLRPVSKSQDGEK